MHTYSTIVVIDSLLKAEEIDATIDKIERNIVNNGGTILKVDRWGKKRLAYEIKKRQYGYYIEILFKAVGNIIKIIEREYGLDENILRYLTLKLDRKALVFYQSKLEEAKAEKETEAPTTETEKASGAAPSAEMTVEADSASTPESNKEDVPADMKTDQESHDDDVSPTQETHDDEEDVKHS